MASLGNFPHTQKRHFPYKMVQENSKQMERILNPLAGFDGLKRSKTRVNYVHKNLLAVKEIEQNRRIENEKIGAKSHAKPFKLKRFDKVKVKVDCHWNKKVDDTDRLKPKRPFLRKGGGAKTWVRPPNCSLETTKSQYLGTSFSNGASQKQPYTSYESSHLSNAGSMQEDSRLCARQLQEPSRSERSNFIPSGKHQNYGEIPAYLVDRKKRLIEEKIREYESSCENQPPGMKALSKEERIHSLKLLKDNTKRIRTQLQKLNDQNLTPLLREYRDELHEKLAEQEAAVEIFSREKVMVQDDYVC